MRKLTTSARPPPAASTAVRTLAKACRAWAARSIPPTSRCCASQAVWPERYSVRFPLAATTCEKPYGSLEKRAGGLNCSLGTAVPPILTGATEAAALGGPPPAARDAVHHRVVRALADGQALVEHALSPRARPLRHPLA